MGPVLLPSLPRPHRLRQGVLPQRHPLEPQGPTSKGRHQIPRRQPLHLLDPRPSTTARRRRRSTSPTTARPAPSPQDQRARRRSPSPGSGRRPRRRLLGAEQGRVRHQRPPQGRQVGDDAQEPRPPLRLDGARRRERREGQESRAREEAQAREHAGEEAAEEGAGRE